MFLLNFSNILVWVSLLTIIKPKNIKGSPNPYPESEENPAWENKKTGDPLFLTPLIEQGKIKEAKEQAAVHHSQMHDVESYAGYLTVNKKYNSNMFFWFFPAQINPLKAPVILWLQGGPGVSSLFGLFTENGPFKVTQNRTLDMKKYSWSVKHNLLYIDNPVGTGYSFTDHDEGYATNETQVSADLYSALTQFFQVFSELRSNDFFATGGSYGGKFVPALSYTIHKNNPKSDIKINLKGLAIANGLTDPINQFDHGDHHYQLGLIDFNALTQFHAYEDKARSLISKQKYNEALEVFQEKQSLAQNLTGFDFYFNYIQIEDVDEYVWTTEWVQSVEARRAIHVGNQSFSANVNKVVQHLKSDITQSQADKIAILVEHYLVLIYNGQLDLLIPYPLTENYLRNLKWSKADEYKTAPRKIWRVNNKVAGYSKTAGYLTEVLVRNAGHMPSMDQPEWVLDLISRLTNNQPF